MDKIAKCIFAVAVFVAALSMLSRMPRSDEAPDLAPGSRFTVGEDLDGSACRNENLAVGQYVSRICAGDASKIIQPHLYGLGEAMRPKRPGRYWIRVDADAIMLARALNGDCKIVAIVRDRFVSDPNAPDATAYKGLAVYQKRNMPPLVTPRG